MAITLKHPRPVTDEELLALSDLNPEYQFERTAAGVLIVTPTGSDSARREARLIRQLDVWAEREGHGTVFSSTALFILPDGSRLMPDASWIRRDRYDRLAAEERRKFAPLCPDAAFEIRSESNTVTDLREKMRAYLANGARIAVLIDPYARTVEVCRPGREPQVLTKPATVALAPELPGFTLDLGPIFTD